MKQHRAWNSILFAGAMLVMHAAALFGATFVVPLWLLSFCILGAICLLLKDLIPRIESSHKEYLS